MGLVLAHPPRHPRNFASHASKGLGVPFPAKTEKRDEREPKYPLTKDETMLVKTNYHTHHRLCRHARGTTADYVEKALELGFKEIGMSDHAPHAHFDDDTRMRPEELPLYLADIERTRGRYGERIRILSGLEVEYDPDTDAYYESLLEKVDYLVLGQHYLEGDPVKNGVSYTFDLESGEDLIAYAKIVREAISTGYFAFVAHPDIFLAGYPRFDASAEEASRIIAESAKEHGVLLEFNANGIRRGLVQSEEGEHYHYPRKPFFDIAKATGSGILLSSDAHSPEELYDDAMREAERIIDRWGLTIRETLAANTK